jgi:hypothetical protein
MAGLYRFMTDSGARFFTSRDPGITRCAPFYIKDTGPRKPCEVLVKTARKRFAGGGGQ